MCRYVEKSTYTLSVMSWYNKFSYGVCAGIFSPLAAIFVDTRSITIKPGSYYCSFVHNYDFV